MGGNADYTATELRHPGYTAMEHEDGGSSRSKCGAAPYSATECTEAHDIASHVRYAGNNAFEMKAAELTEVYGRATGDLANECRAADCLAADCKAADCSVSDEANFMASQPQHVGYSAHEIKATGLTGMQCRATAHPDSECETVGFCVIDCKAADCSVGNEARLFDFADPKGGTFRSPVAVGLMERQGRAMGHSAIEGRDVGSSAAEFSAADGKAADCSVREVVTDLKSIDCFVSDETNFLASQLRCAGYSAHKMKAEGYIGMQCRVIGYPDRECRAAEFSAADCKAFEYSVSELHDMRLATQSMPSELGNAASREQMFGDNAAAKAAAADARRMRSLQFSLGKLQNTQMQLAARVHNTCSSSIEQGDVEGCLRGDICSTAIGSSVTTSGVRKDADAPAMRLATGSIGTCRANIDNNINNNIKTESNSRSSFGSFSVLDNQLGGLVHPPHQLSYSDNQSIRSSHSKSFRSTDNPKHRGSLDVGSNRRWIRSRPDSGTLIGSPESGKGCADIADSLAPLGSNESLGGDATASADATASMHYLHEPPMTLCSTEERLKVDELEGREPRWIGANSRTISQHQSLAKGSTGRCEISAMTSGGATLVSSSISDKGQCVPCNSFTGDISGRLRRQFG